MADELISFLLLFSSQNELSNSSCAVVHGILTGCLRCAADCDNLGNDVVSFALAWGTSFLVPRFEVGVELWETPSGEPLPPKLSVARADGAPLSAAETAATEAFNKDFARVVPAARRELVLLAVAGVGTAIANDVSPAEVRQFLGGMLRRLSVPGCYTRNKIARAEIIELVVVLIAMCRGWKGLTREHLEAFLKSTGGWSALVRGTPRDLMMEASSRTVAVGAFPEDVQGATTDFAFEDENPFGGEEEDAVAEEEEEEEEEGGDDNGDGGDDGDEGDEDEEMEEEKDVEEDGGDDDDDDDGDDDDGGGDDEAMEEEKDAEEDGGDDDGDDEDGGNDDDEDRDDEEEEKGDAERALSAALRDPKNFLQKLFRPRCRRPTTCDVSEDVKYQQQLRGDSDEMLALVRSTGLPTTPVVGDAVNGGAVAAGGSSSSSSSVGDDPLSGYAGPAEALSQLRVVRHQVVEGQAAPSWKRVVDAGANGASPASSSSSSHPPLLVKDTLRNTEVLTCSLYATMVPRPPTAMEMLSEVIVSLTSAKDARTRAFVVPLLAVVYRVSLHLEAKGKPNALSVAVLDALPFLQHFESYTGDTERKKAAALYFAVAAFQLDHGGALCPIGEAIKMAKKLGLPTWTSVGTFWGWRNQDKVITDVLGRHVHIYDVPKPPHFAVRGLCGCCDWAENRGNDSA